MVTDSTVAAARDTSANVFRPTVVGWGRVGCYRGTIAVLVSATSTDPVADRPQRPVPMSFTYA